MLINNDIFTVDFEKGFWTMRIPKQILDICKMHLQRFKNKINDKKQSKTTKVSEVL